MTNEEPPTKPKKRTNRFYKVLAITIILLAIILGVVIFELSDIYQNSYGSGPVEIGVTTDKPFYLQGEEINFTIYVNNPYDWKIPHPHEVTYRIEGKDNFTQSSTKFVDFPSSSVPTFSPHTRIFYSTYTWNQKVQANNNIKLAQPGNYTFSVTFSGLVAYGNGDSCVFEVRENPKP